MHGGGTRRQHLRVVDPCRPSGPGVDGDSAREPRCGDELLFIGTVGLKAKHRQAIMSRLGYEDGGVLRR